MLDATNVNAHATPDAVDSSFDPTSLELGDLFTFTAGPADDCGGWGVVIRALAEDAVTVRAWVMADNRTHRMVEIVSLSRITGRVSEPSQLQRAAVGEGLAVEIRNLADDDRITQARLDALAQQVGSLTGQLEDQQQAATRFRARVRAEALRVRTGQVI